LTTGENEWSLRRNYGGFFIVRQAWRVARKRRPINLRLSDYYRCVEDFFEELERVHEERYQARFGYLRTEIRLTIFRYLDCGCLHNGFSVFAATTAVTNTWLPSPASAAISARRAIRNV